MAETNGQNSGGERLDRIEAILATLAEEHIKFSTEHKQLLTAQVVLTDRVNTLARRMEEFVSAHRETEDRLGILIKMMDEWIRRSPAPQQ